MVDGYLRELDENDYVELDGLLREFYSYVKDEMIERNDFTKFSVEMRAMGYLGTLFSSLKSFDKISKKCNKKEGISVEIISNEKFDDEHTERVLDVLKRYIVFVIKCFNSIKEVSKERALNLAVLWLKDYLRVTAYKISYMNVPEAKNIAA